MSVSARDRQQLVGACDHLRDIELAKKEAIGLAIVALFTRLDREEAVISSDVRVEDIPGHLNLPMRALQYRRFDVNGLLELCQSNVERIDAVARLNREYMARVLDLDFTERGDLLQRIGDVRRAEDYFVQDSDNLLDFMSDIHRIIDLLVGEVRNEGPVVLNRRRLVGL